jgi:hypothetical protein
VAGSPVRALGVTAGGAVVCASIAVAAGLALGAPRAGLAFALGLLIGATNGLLARRGVMAGLPASASSLGRLAILSAVGLAIGFLFGVDVAWLVPLGLGVAQLLLSAAAVVEMVRQ